MDERIAALIGDRAGTPKPNLVSAADIAAAAATFAHPWNPRSRLHGTRMSMLAGLSRTAVSRVKLAPGAESFVYHAHRFEEEWLYILEGRGIAEIDGREYEVGPGDFMGFPTPSVAHHLRNPYDRDLVYLMGGENRQFEAVDFPRQGKRMVRIGTDMTVYDAAEGRPFGPMAEPER